MVRSCLILIPLHKLGGIKELSPSISALLQLALVIKGTEYSYQGNGMVTMPCGYNYSSVFIEVLSVKREAPSYLMVLYQLGTSVSLVSIIFSTYTM